MLKKMKTMLCRCLYYGRDFLFDSHHLRIKPLNS